MSSGFTLLFFSLNKKVKNIYYCNESFHKTPNKEIFDMSIEIYYNTGTEVTIQTAMLMIMSEMTSNVQMFPTERYRGEGYLITERGIVTRSDNKTIVIEPTCLVGMFAFRNIIYDPKIDVKVRDYIFDFMEQTEAGLAHWYRETHVGRLVSPTSYMISLIDRLRPLVADFFESLQYKLRVIVPMLLNEIEVAKRDNVPYRVSVLDQLVPWTLFKEPRLRWSIELGLKHTENDTAIYKLKPLEGNLSKADYEHALQVLAVYRSRNDLGNLGFFGLYLDSKDLNELKEIAMELEELWNEI